MLLFSILLISLILILSFNVESSMFPLCCFFFFALTAPSIFDLKLILNFIACDMLTILPTLFQFSSLFFHFECTQAYSDLDLVVASTDILLSCGFLLIWQTSLSWIAFPPTCITSVYGQRCKGEYGKNIPTHGNVTLCQLNVL